MSSIDTTRLSEVILKLRDDMVLKQDNTNTILQEISGLNTKLNDFFVEPVDLSWVVISNSIINPPYDENILDVSCYLYKFTCDIVLDAVSVGDAIQTEFFDVSGTTSAGTLGTKLFGILTAVQYVKGNNGFGYAQHTLDFPNPIYVRNGIGVYCEDLVGNATAVRVNATFWYKPL